MKMCDGDGNVRHDSIVYEERDCPLCDAYSTLSTADSERDRVSEFLRDLTVRVNERLTANLRGTGVDYSGGIADLPSVGVAQYTPIISANIVAGWVSELRDLMDKLEDIKLEAD